MVRASACTGLCSQVPMQFTHQVSIRSSFGPVLWLVLLDEEPLPEPLEDGNVAPSGMDSSRFMLWCAPWFTVMAL